MKKEKVNNKVPDFNSVPIPLMCQSIQMLIENLESRGYPVRDFDNKNKIVKQVGVIGGKVYFLASKEDNHGKKA